MTFAAAPRLHADNDFAKCRRNSEKAELKWQKVIADHGRGSDQARDAMKDVRDQRESCYEHIHQWWNAKDQKWEKNDHVDKGLQDHSDHGPDAK